MVEKTLHYRHRASAPLTVVVAPTYCTRSISTRDLLHSTQYHTTMAAYEIVERDEAGNIISTYVASGEGRVDVIVRVYHSGAIEARFRDIWSHDTALVRVKARSLC
jgi:hypothetical protein